MAVAVALMALAPTVAQAKTHKPKRDIYVALGDSLAVGVQPQASGKSVNTKQGYADQLAKRAKVKLVDFGCGFATSSSISRGDRPCAPAIKHLRYKNTSRKTSQLATAERYIKAHRDRIAFVTLDIGANDVAGCAEGGKLDIPCVTAGIAQLKKNVPSIAKGLRKAAGKHVPIAGMTLYNPFLQQWFTNPALAQATVGIAKTQVNAQLISSYKKGKLKIADVGTAFGTYKPFSQTTTYHGRTDVPVAVANICKYTWMCAPAPRGPNIHANKKGYALIASQFQKALGKVAK